MTKPKLEARLLNIITNYKRLYETLKQADAMVREEKYKIARDFLNVASYRIEQTQIELEHTLREIELTPKLNNYHDTRPNEDQ